MKNLAGDPVLRNVKLIAEAWDAGGLYQVGSFPAYTRWAEWNGKYRDDMRSFLKGDYWFAQAAANRLTGSLDLYTGQYKGYDSSINFLTCHDGFLSGICILIMENIMNPMDGTILMEQMTTEAGIVEWKERPWILRSVNSVLE